MGLHAALAALLAITALNVACTFYNLALLKQLVPPAREYTYIGHDHPDQLPLALPEVGLELTTGAPHFDIHNDSQWGTLFPSDGFTPLPLPLSPLSPNQNQTTFLLSMIHQMHCLDVLRVAFLRNATGAAEHTQHCLRYLRQVVLCYADTTLEEDRPAFIEGRWVHGGSGVGSVHRCRDWTRVRRYLLDNPSKPVDWAPPEGAE